MTGTARLRSPPEIACDVRGLELMLSAARLQARRLGRTLRLSAEEQDDAEQDILLVLLERYHYFDEARGHLTAFIYRIARQATQAIADRITANWATGTVSLELSASREAGDDEAPASPGAGHDRDHSAAVGWHCIVSDHTQGEPCLDVTDTVQLPKQCGSGGSDCCCHDIA